MTSKCTAQLLADLGVTRSLSRPQVSDDNPFSEAQFKTLKYHPGFPGRFHDLTAAIAFCRSFFPWYNTEHRHAGIAMLTPEDVHHHRAHSVLEQRERTLQAAWTRHPERFVRGVPTTRPPSPSGLDQPTPRQPQQEKLLSKSRFASVSKSLTGSASCVWMSETRGDRDWDRRGAPATAASAVPAGGRSICRGDPKSPGPPPRRTWARDDAARACGQSDRYRRGRASNCARRAGGRL